MPTVTKDGLAQIKAAAIHVHESLYALEHQYKACRGHLPVCFQLALDHCLKAHHGDLGELRGIMLENLDIEPLTDEEIIALGGPGGGGK